MSRQATLALSVRIGSINTPVRITCSGTSELVISTRTRTIRNSLTFFPSGVMVLVVVVGEGEPHHNLCLLPVPRTPTFATNDFFLQMYIWPPYVSTFFGNDRLMERKCFSKHPSHTPGSILPIFYVSIFSPLSVQFSVRLDLPRRDYDDRLPRRLESPSFTSIVFLFFGF